MKLNSEELLAVAKIFAVHGTSSEDQAKALMGIFQLDRLVVTCGEQGVWQMDDKGRKFTSEGPGGKTRIVDTVGAGDAFSALLILGMTAKWSMDVTLERANTFAAAVCEIRGAVPEHADFYQPFIEVWKL